MPGDLIIETERLVMREFNQDDVDSMFELNSDEEVTRYTGDQRFEDKTEVIRLIDTYDEYERYKMGRWSLLLKSTGDYIGFCGLKYLAELNEADLGFRLMKKYWNQGYATESSVAALNYGFDTLQLEKIVGRAASENTRSLRVLEKLGMVFETDFREHGRPCRQYMLTGNGWSKHKELFFTDKLNG